MQEDRTVVGGGRMMRIQADPEDAEDLERRTVLDIRLPLAYNLDKQISLLTHEWRTSHD